MAFLKRKIMFIINKLFLTLIIIFLQLTTANGVEDNNYNCPIANYQYNNIFSPEEFIQKLTTGNLPNTPIVITADVVIKNSSIANLPDNLTINGLLKLQNCNSITHLPKNIIANSIYIINCPNLNDFGNNNCPIAIN
jgi:hypothetical protein